MGCEGCKSQILGKKSQAGVQLVHGSWRGMASKLPIYIKGQDRMSLWKPDLGNGLKIVYGARKLVVNRSGKETDVLNYKTASDRLKGYPRHKQRQQSLEGSYIRLRRL